jgi:hypothetical protein
MKPNGTYLELDAILDVCVGVRRHCVVGISSLTALESRSAFMPLAGPLHIGPASLIRTHCPHLSI